MRDCCQHGHPATPVYRVMVVDDHERVAALAADYLEHREEHFQTTAATDQETAIAAVRNGEVDCLVTDYNMPGRTGLELCEAVREIDADLDCILFTSEADPGLAEQSSAADVGFVRKRAGTDHLDELAAEIHRAVKRPLDGARHD